ncbi:MAG: RidA family protein [Hylemonella sp.]|nr:RidA family protein [Hylemonella sp.]
MELIHIAGQAPPAGHYSPAAAAGGFVFVSGMLPSTDPAEAASLDFEAQARRVLGRCEQVLAAADCRLDQVVQCTVYMVGMAHWSAFNRVYQEVMGAHKPARAVVPVPELHHGFLVEVTMTAWRGR